MALRVCRPRPFGVGAFVKVRLPLQLSTSLMGLETGRPAIPRKLHRRVPACVPTGVEPVRRGEGIAGLSELAVELEAAEATPTRSLRRRVGPRDRGDAGREDHRQQRRNQESRRNGEHGARSAPGRQPIERPHRLRSLSLAPQGSPRQPKVPGPSAARRDAVLGGPVRGVKHPADGLVGVAAPRPRGAPRTSSARLGRRRLHGQDLVEPAPVARLAAERRTRGRPAHIRRPAPGR